MTEQINSPSEPFAQALTGSGANSYARAIAIHCPGCSEYGMRLRCEIAALRDKAAMGALQSTDSTAVLLGEVSRLATYAVFAGVPDDKLARILAALEITMTAARAIELVTRNG